MLLDILAASLNLHKVPIKMGWRILDLYQSRRLDSPEGLRILKRACMLVEPEKTRMVMRWNVR